MRGVTSLLAAVLVSVALPEPAGAHLMNTGFGPFYDGLTHLFLTPEDLLPVIALTLLGGLGGPRVGRAVLFALPPAWLAGTFVGARMLPHLSPSVAPAGVTIALGVLVALDLSLPRAWVAGLAIGLGLVNGGLNGAELAGVESRGLVAAGVACALFIVVALLSGQVASLRAAWARIAARVAGSWIAAVGLLMLGWAFRTP